MKREKEKEGMKRNYLFINEHFLTIISYKYSINIVSQEVPIFSFQEALAQNLADPSE